MTTSHLFPSPILLGVTESSIHFEHNLDEHPYNINLLTGRVLRPLIPHHPRQRLVRVARIRGARVPAIVQRRVIRAARRDLSIIEIARNGQLIRSIERDLLRVFSGGEQRHRDVRDRVVAEFHGRRNVEVAPAQLVGQDPDDADFGVGRRRARVVEVVLRGRGPGDCAAVAEAFDGGAFVAGHEGRSVDGRVLRVQDEGEGCGLVCELRGGLGGREG